MIQHQTPHHNCGQPLRDPKMKIARKMKIQGHANAKKALRDYHGWNDPLDAPFAAVLDALEIAKGNNRAAASESLRNAGIPGIRYLDGGSRADGAGTSNFVVFPGEESALTILERNGKPVRK